MKWLLIAALGLALSYEAIAALSHHWPTISQLAWGLEQHTPWYAVLLLIGYIVLGVHLFARHWRKS